MRYIYNLLFYLAFPFVLARLLWRSRKLPSYRQRLAERLGYYSRPIKSSCIWVHAVSMGETIAATPLIKSLIKENPGVPVLVTTMTPTGAERVRTTFGDQVTHLYIPYDLPGAVKRFLNAAKPRVGIIMETELWPNLIHACHVRGIPLCLVNARLSEKSARGYGRIAPLARQMLQQLSAIAAHGHADAERFIALGAEAERMTVTGSLKFDLELPADLAKRSQDFRAQLGQNRFVWCAASTHEGEEEMALAAHKALRARHPNALLILVPRHPERFNDIAALAAQSFPIKRRSLKETADENTGVYLGDTMGELMMVYGAVDVAFVGGSLIPRGGHNMLEPAALGKPLLTGVHLFNFAEMSELFVNAKALIKVNDANDLAKQLQALADDETLRTQLGERAQAVVEANRGALAKQLQIVQRAGGLTHEPPHDSDN